MKHAASVRPEPGSNSPLSESLCPSEAFASCSTLLKSCPLILFVVESTGIVVFSYSIFKVQNLLNKLFNLIDGTYLAETLFQILVNLIRFPTHPSRRYFIVTLHILLSSDFLNLLLI